MSLSARNPAAHAGNFRLRPPAPPPFPQSFPQSFPRASRTRKSKNNLKPVSNSRKTDMTRLQAVYVPPHSIGRYRTRIRPWRALITEARSPPLASLFGLVQGRTASAVQSWSWPWAGREKKSFLVSGRAFGAAERGGTGGTNRRSSAPCVCMWVCWRAGQGWTLEKSGEG